MTTHQGQGGVRLEALEGGIRAPPVRLLAAGLDEVPGTRKNIRRVMAAQADLLENVAQFDPGLVLLRGDGGSAED